MTIASVREAFEAQHHERYGYRDADAAIEVVTIRATARMPGPELDLAAATARGGTVRSARGATVVFDGRSTTPRSSAASRAPGERIDGPGDLRAARGDARRAARLGGSVDDAGTIVLQRSEAA